MYGAWLTYRGVVLLSHTGCPYICGYIWSGYAGTTNRSRRQLCISTSWSRGSDHLRIKVSTIHRLLSLSCAANSHRILPMFSYKYATKAHRLQEQCW